MRIFEWKITPSPDDNELTTLKDRFKLYHPRLLYLIRNCQIFLLKVITISQKYLASFACFYTLRKRISAETTDVVIVRGLFYQDAPMYKYAKLYNLSMYVYNYTMYV